MVTATTARTETVGETLRRMRAEWSQAEVEAATGVNRGNLSRYEHGHVLPSRRDLARLCRHYGLDFDALAARVAREWMVRKGEAA